MTMLTPGFASAPASATMCHTCSVTAKFLAALLGDISFQDFLRSALQVDCHPLSHIAGMHNFS